MVGATALASGLAPTTAGDGDQDRIGDALSASSIRVLQAGFWSVGPGTRDADFVSSCLGGLDSPGRLAPFPDETARGVSNVYLYQPDADTTPEVGELLTVAVVSVDEASRLGLDWFVLLLGSTNTAECRREEFLAANASGQAQPDVTVAIDAAATPELAVGDAASRLDLHLVFTQGAERNVVTHSYLVARTGRTLVVMRHSTFGAGPFTGLDPVAELGAIVASIDSG
jgi:hypothetical protein